MATIRLALIPAKGRNKAHCHLIQNRQPLTIQKWSSRQASRRSNDKYQVTHPPKRVSRKAR